MWHIRACIAKSNSEDYEVFENRQNCSAIVVATVLKRTLRIYDKIYYEIFGVRRGDSDGLVIQPEWIHFSHLCKPSVNDAASTPVSSDVSTRQGTTVSADTAVSSDVSAKQDSRQVCNDNISNNENNQDCQRVRFKLDEISGNCSLNPDIASNMSKNTIVTNESNIIMDAYLPSDGKDSFKSQIRIHDDCVIQLKTTQDNIEGNKDDEKNHKEIITSGDVEEKASEFLGISNSSRKRTRDEYEENELDVFVYIVTSGISNHYKIGHNSQIMTRFKSRYHTYIGEFDFLKYSFPYDKSNIADRNRAIEIAQFVEKAFKLVQEKNKAYEGHQFELYRKEDEGKDMLSVYMKTLTKIIRHYYSKVR